MITRAHWVMKYLTNNNISDEWQKIGKYNSFITNQIRKVTDKTIVYSMNVPISFKTNSI